ncbi:uncharacterized protein LOC127411111 [Myxocyprinus asiaticus]|uniref:uncharacterized protein LOC127411111 n=1 Tax=Myxocyprinus asiaticus TaxID=70543 RepID=UPI0022229A0A|nr:uncharacterized protein LOC127411111 [Myxocyprinus asiaticus]
MVVADFSDNVLITQWPKYISTLPGSPVEMHCYQNDTNYDYKYWYRQIKGDARCVNIQQKLHLLASKNNRAEITCSHNDSGMLNMFWYQQKDTAIVLIGYNYAMSDPNYEDGFKKRFEIKRKDTLNGALIIPDLSLSDFAVYYCAVSVHSAICYNYCLSKTQEHRKPKQWCMCCSISALLPDVLTFHPSQEQRSRGELSLISMSLGKDIVEIVSPFENTKYSMTRPEIKESSLEIKSLVEEDSGVYFCASSIGCANYQAYFGKGTKLTVLELGKKATGPQNITLQELSKKEKCKLHVTLVCVVQNFYPDHLKIKWKIGGTEVTKGVATDNEATKNGNKMFDMSSRLKVSREQWNNAENTFTCTYTFFDGSVYITDFRTVKGTAVSGFNRDEHIKSAQMIKLGYGVFIAKSGLYGLIILVFVWRKGSAGNYAKVEFGEGTKLTVLAAKISKPNVKVLPPSPREICSQNKTNKTSTLVCVASDFYPDHVHVTWQVNGKDRNTNVATDITAQQDQSTLQYTITSRMKVDDADWMNPKNIFTCTVYFYNGMQTINVPHSIKGQKAHRGKLNPRSLNTFGFGYILFLSKSVLYALIMAGLVWKLKFSIDRKQLSED